MTPEQFAKIFPKADPKWFDAFVPAMQQFEINTPKREAMFFAQIYHESAGLTRLEESFNYTAKRLMEVFPFVFRTIEKAQEYVLKGPEAIGNKVYALRMGNGSEASGDGYKFRGRCPIQLTGRDNYLEFDRALVRPYVAYPELVSSMKDGAMISCQFWKTRGCNAQADSGNITKCTILINGGTNGLADRKKQWERIKEILNV